MQRRILSATVIVLYATIGASLVTLTPNACSAQPDDLRKLDGEWLYVEDRTEGRAKEKQGPPMNVKFVFRVEKDAVIYPRPRGDEHITLDGSVIEKKNNNGSVTRYRGKWNDGVLEYTLETVRLSDNQRVSMIRREFRVTDDGLQIDVIYNKRSKSVALYRHPEDIPLPKPAKGQITDMVWLADVWNGTSSRSSTEERWSPPLGGAMLGVSRTVRDDKMVAFEYLRIVERDNGLVYIAQPGGRSSTEFVLTQLSEKHAEFVNPRHDYPQRIVYKLSDDGTLIASIGFINGGRPKQFQFTREAK